MVQKSLKQAAIWLLKFILVFQYSAQCEYFVHSCVIEKNSWVGYLHHGNSLVKKQPKSLRSHRLNWSPSSYHIWITSLLWNGQQNWMGMSLLVKQIQKESKYGNQWRYLHLINLCRCGARMWPCEWHKQKDIQTVSFFGTEWSKPPVLDDRESQIRFGSVTDRMRKLCATIDLIWFGNYLFCSATVYRHIGNHKDTAFAAALSICLRTSSRRLHVWNQK